MVTDPVCFAVIDDDAQFTSTLNDQKYYFCSRYCKKKFDENPRKYSRISCELNIDPGGTSC
jgi:xanthine dehydrogenase accessory factor